jgi:hypothetical protein
MSPAPKKSTSRKREASTTEVAPMKPKTTKSHASTTAIQDTEITMTPKTTHAGAPAPQTTENAMTTTTTPIESTVLANPQPAPSLTTASTVTSTGLAALVAQLSAALDAAEAQMGAGPTATTAAQKRARAKPRRGGDKAIAQLAPIVKQFGLDSASLSSDQMLSRNQLAQTLIPLQARLQKITKRVDDDVFGAQADAWDIGLQFYSLLRRRAKVDGNVAQAIAPLAKSFAYRNPKVREGKPGKVATRVKARLKETVALAQKHGVTVTVGPDGAVAGMTGAPQAVAAAQAELATGAQTVAAPAQGGAVLAAATPAQGGAVPPAATTAPHS